MAVVAADHVRPESYEVLTDKVYVPLLARTFEAANEMEGVEELGKVIKVGVGPPVTVS